MVQRRETGGSEQAVIIGAGIAGALLARTLAERNIPVSVIDPDLPTADNDPARQGALYVRPAVNYSPETRFAHQAFLYAADYYARLQANTPALQFWHPTGTLQLAWNERERLRQEKLVANNRYHPDFLRAVSEDEASQLAGTGVGCGGLWFPRGGHLAHSPFRTAALDHPGITTIAARVTGQPERLGSGGWRIPVSSGSLPETRILVCTAGACTGNWFPGLPLQSIRGQVTRLRAPDITLKAAISGAGYALPPVAGTQVIGATFDKGDDDPRIREDSHNLNLKNLAQWFPQLGTRYKTGDIEDGWVGFRSTTPDHLPVAGVLDGIYMIAGLGGKGLAYAPILAREVADAIRGDTSILDQDLRNRLTPGRFL